MNKRAAVLILLPVLVVGSVWLNWPNSNVPDAPPFQDAGQIRAADDGRLIPLVINDLRWKLAVVPAERRDRWRSWPEPARHAYALAWLENDNGPGAPSAFEGFGAIVGATGEHLPTLAEMSEAYAAIGAQPCAAIVAEAAKIDASSGPAAFTDCDNRLRRQMAVCKTRALYRDYLRSHAEDVAAALPPN
jgi:hypothetical protein